MVRLLDHVLESWFGGKAQLASKAQFVTSGSGPERYADMLGRAAILRDCSRSPDAFSATCPRRLLSGEVDLAATGSAAYSTLAVCPLGKPAIRILPRVARVKAKISMLGTTLPPGAAFASEPVVADAITAARASTKLCEPRQHGEAKIQPAIQRDREASQR